MSAHIESCNRSTSSWLDIPALKYFLNFFLLKNNIFSITPWGAALLESVTLYFNNRIIEIDQFIGCRLRGNLPNLVFQQFSRRFKFGCPLISNTLHQPIFQMGFWDFTSPFSEWDFGPG